MSICKIYGKVSKVFTQDSVAPYPFGLSCFRRVYRLEFGSGHGFSFRSAPGRVTRMHSQSVSALVLGAQHGQRKTGMIGFAEFCSSSLARNQAILRTNRTGLVKIYQGLHEFARSSNSSSLSRCSRHSSLAVQASKGRIAAGQGAPSLQAGSFLTSKRWSGSFLAVSHFGRCYFELSKARLSLFVVSSAAVGFVLGSGESVDWARLAWTSAGTMLVAASANSFNQILEVVNDGKMKRTMRRPLPAGRMSILHASIFAVFSGMIGLTSLACKANTLTAELGLANVVLYTLVYTPMKQIHHINTWVGAVVGAIPPLMGWAAATGQIEAGGCVLASALYFWQIPHFMALAFLCRRDYAAGGYKMLSLFDSSGQRTAFCALRNCIYLLPLGFLSAHLGLTSVYFGYENLLLTLGIGATSVYFCARPNTESARRLFRVSLLYLPVVMSGMVLHRNPHSTMNSLDKVTNDQEQERSSSSKSAMPLPPISFISAPPFPFLAPPDYHRSQM